MLGTRLHPPWSRLVWILAVLVEADGLPKFIGIAERVWIVLLVGEEGRLDAYHFGGIRERGTMANVRVVCDEVAVRIMTFEGCTFACCNRGRVEPVDDVVLWERIRPFLVHRAKMALVGGVRVSLSQRVWPKISIWVVDVAVRNCVPEDVAARGGAGG